MSGQKPLEIGDGSGYVLCAADLDFLGISDVDVEHWEQRLRPLGISLIQFEGFLSELAGAMRADGLEPSTVDLRLKGSSVAFFSGHHKTLPTARDDFDKMFVELNRRLPLGFELAEIESRFRSLWPVPGRHPKRRPFDSMYKLGIDPYPSDFDLQLSSDEVVERCKDELSRRGLRTDKLRVENRTYNFVNKELVEKAVPRLTGLCDELTKALRRGVSIAVFSSAGPPDVSAVDGELSSHFRDSDWVLLQ